MIELQRICLKILTDAPPTVNLDPFLAIFSRRRLDTSHPAQWVDLADYAHMPKGPGIMLVGHLCNFSFDLGDPAPGILYCSKKGLTGTAEDRLWTVFRDAFAMARLLAAEKEFPAGVELRTGSLELVFNDRLEVPHNGATDSELRPAVSAVLDRLLGRGAYKLIPESDPDRRYGFCIEAKGAAGLEVLVSRLAE